MKKTNKILVTILIFSHLFLLTGCQVFEPNQRWYKKDNVQFWGNLNIETDRKYTILQIGTPEKPLYISNNDFKIRLISNETVSLKSSQIEKIKLLSKRIADPNQYGEEWPENSEGLYLDHLYIIVKDNKILHLTAKQSEIKKESIAISDGNSNTFHEFPLTEGQVVEIFGKEGGFVEFFMH